MCRYLVLLVYLGCCATGAAEEFPPRAADLPVAVAQEDTALRGRWPSLHNGGNTSTELQRLPLHWSEAEGIRWQVQLPGYGQSAPAIWDGRIYVTAIEGDQKETCILLVFDLATGTVLWTHRFPATTQMENSYMVSRAAPTPMVDQQGVYALFESGDLHALTHAGQLRWSLSLFDEHDRHFDNAHGYGASPAQTSDAIIVVVDHRGPSYLAAISKMAGQEIWKTARTSRASWTSPKVTQVGDHEQIVISSGGTVDGYDTATGKQLWSHTGLTGNMIISATVQGDRVFVGADVGNREQDAESAQASNCCLRITPDSAEAYVLQWKAQRALAHYASPLAHGPHVYYLNKVGVLYCLDTQTGEEIFAQRTRGPCWAQPIAAGRHLYLFHKDGQTTVIEAGRTFSVVARNRLWSEEPGSVRETADRLNLSTTCWNDHSTKTAPMWTMRCRRPG
jgi:outer membrane protein assembly factor BamB